MIGTQVKLTEAQTEALRAYFGLDQPLPEAGNSHFRVHDASGGLVAIGTVADMMPLQGENRGLVLRGLAQLNKTARPGLELLPAAEAPLEGTAAKTAGAPGAAHAVADREDRCCRTGHRRRGQRMGGCRP